MKGAKLRGEMELLQKEMDALMNDGSKKLSAEWYIKQQATEAIVKKSVRHVGISGLCGVGVLLCARMELKEIYEEYEEDSNEGAAEGAHHGGGHESGAHHGAVHH